MISNQPALRLCRFGTSIVLGCLFVLTAFAKNIDDVVVLRMQASSDLRIKIVKDLWFGFHIYENFDNKPPVRADKNDLGVSTSVGWKF